MTSAESDSTATAAILRIGPRTFPIESDRIYVIGSGEKADVRIVHDSVAGYHATFSAHEGKLCLEDLGSESGTYIGDVRVRGLAELPAGTDVRLGSILLSVGVPGSPDAAVPPPPVHAHASSPFADLMAEELRRAPWLGASLLLHVALFLLLWFLLADDRIGRRGRRVISIDPPLDNESIDFGELTPEDERFEVEEDPNQELELQDVELSAISEEFDEEPAAFDEPSSFVSDRFGGSSMFDRIGGGPGGADVLQSIGGGGANGGFKRTVEGLRESGLEIVFVFDSTGSMGPVLEATRQRITRMLEALVALVPDAHVGVVTYRDRGQREDYLVRSVPIGRDLYRSINFMHTVNAGGGGDRPEAVLDGLSAAMKQDWSRDARRVIVLIGDAPAHAETERQIIRMVRSFTRSDGGFVHAIVTSPDVLGDVDPRTRKSFEAIAKAGKGVCLPFEHEETILRQVLTLAIGEDFREQIDHVYELLATREVPVSRTVREAIATADKDRIERFLSRPTVPLEFMQELNASRDLDVAEVLIGVLTTDRVPERGRQAAAFALQHMLDLPEPPAPVDRGARIGAAKAKELHETAARVLR